jgi:hypothetical protein
MLNTLLSSFSILRSKYWTSLLFLFLGLQIGGAQTCTYTLELFDSFGDGWNGSVLTITINGTMTDYTFTSGDEATFTFNAMSNEAVLVSYAPGFFENEVTYNILDPSGNIIFSDGPFPVIGEVFSFFACPTCPGPLSVNIDEIGGVDAEVSWTPSDSTGTYTVEYGPGGFILGEGTILTTTDTAIVLTDLIEDTEYDFYVSIACDNGDTSAILGPNTFQTIWLVDVGVTEILTPLDACGLGMESVEVTLQNFGALPQSLISFNYSVNGIDAGVSQPTDGFYTGVLSNDSTVTLEFETMFDFSLPGEYEIIAWTALEGDSNSANDSISFTVTNIPVVSDLPYFIDFETWDGGWKIDQDNSFNSTWAFGMPAGEDISSAASGVNAFVTNLEGNYNNNELSYIVSPCFDFSGLTSDPVINFALNFDTETNWDGGWLESSVDGGMSWTKVGAMGTGVNWYTVFNTTQDLGDVWGGNSGGWINVEHPLNGLAGESQVRFRFAFDSDGSVNGFDGIGIDDILISPIFEDDLSLLTVNNNTESDCGSEMDMVTIEIRNAGTNGQTGFDVSYQVNGGEIITENVGALVLNPQVVETYTFTTPFDSKSFATDFEIRAWTDLSEELNFLNDTVSTVFSTADFEQLPLVVDFEDGELPEGWVFSDNTIGNVHNNVSVVIYDNLFAGDQNYEVTTGNIGPVNPGDSLTYDYRYTNWSAGTTPTTLGMGDILLIQISTDCGDTFATLDQVDMTNHTPSAVMTNRTVDLNAYAGEVVKLRFLALWGSGDYWIDIDNINIIGCPADFGLEITTNYETSEGAGDGSIEIEPSNGTAPYTYTWSDPNAPNEIGAGTYTVTITDGLGCEDVVEIELGACPANLALVAEVTGVSTDGASDGSVTINPGDGEGPYFFDWSTGDNTQTVTGLPEGDYTVTVTDGNNCSDEISFTVDIFTNTINIDRFASLALLPNPTNGRTELKVELNQSAMVSVQIVSLVGQVIFETPQEQIINERYTFDLSQQPAGLYFVRIAADSQSKTLKLVKAQ